MARSIKDINDGMIDDKTNVEALSSLTNNSSSSIWRTLFYIVATAIHTLEKIFDLHKREVTEVIENIIPHRPKWYRDMALKYMEGMVLIPETDRYDTSGMTEEEIEERRIVKYATAVESNGNLLVKIATGTAGNLTQISFAPDKDYETSFEYYMNEIRDAGVRIIIVNEPGDNFTCSMTIHYNPTVLESQVRSEVLEAIKGYITGLPFNGEYSNMALVDAVQAVESVRIVHFEGASCSTGENPLSEIPTKIVANAGYFTFDEKRFIDKEILKFVPYVVQQ